MPFHASRTLGAFLTFLLPAGAAFADVNLSATNTCLASSVSQGQNPAQCVDAAHQRCLRTPDDMTASAVLCFGQAKEAWNIGIASEMEAITSVAEDRLAAMAAIELKYDMLANLMQCDRMEELAKAGERASGDHIARQRAQCEASAAGLVYLRVKMRSDSLQ